MAVPSTVGLGGRLRSLPERGLRAGLLALSRRRSLGRLATRVPLGRAMVARFVAGDTFDQARPALERLREAGLRTTVDVLGESVSTGTAARAASDAYVSTLDSLAAMGVDLNVSLKLSQMGLGVDESLCRDNVARILERAGILGAFVRIDMEGSATTDRTLSLWRDLRSINAGRGDSGVVIQAALRRSEADLEALMAESARLRLCKGAYREPPDIAFQGRADIDASYQRLMERLLREGTNPALATHDDVLIQKAIRFARDNDISPERFEFQMLYGVRRDLQARLVKAGYAVRVYVPFGDQWYPYFMRRLAERPANVAFVLRSILGERRGSPSN